MSFSHDDVQRLIKLLDSSHFDELQLEAEGIKLMLRRNGAGSAPAAPTGPSAQAAPPPPMAAPTQPAAASAPTSDSTLLEIRAPMLGTFYGAPKPGAAPFVAIGDRVDAETAVGIIEVMKLMNSIAARVEGELVEVLVRDGDLVEFEQVLLRVRPV